jgi:sugar lactone lactonase YvrE
VLVLDEATHWVQVFDGDGRFLRKWGGGEAGMYHPRAMAIDGAGTVYIADTGRKRVLVYGPDGVLRKELGSAATAGLPASERLLEPAGVAVAVDGSVFVADAPVRLVRRYDSAGRQQAAWGVGPADAVDGPRLAAAPNGTVYVTAPALCMLVRFDLNGAPVDSSGKCDSPDYLGRPSGIALDGAGKLYVTDVSQGVVRVYAP